MNDLYETDFYAWTQDQGARLRARAGFDNRGDIDWENAAEEIESLGRSEKREIENRLAILVLHLLKWRYQPTRRSRSWQATIIEQRRRIAREVLASPSLAAYPAAVLAEEYDFVRRKAAVETRQPETLFPPRCPFTIEEILDPAFYPEES
ncbi:DUF29 domain-containing protein [Aurantimonas sp. Leaf443]|uniref:DUF29 domain-containing protein n=1 Tax=Aurantimonas sp. Leaf443 TaxID=1736378 RepID=UPI0009EC3319|nr:DUF29 domain-containing protein [Aurantimonas sp. Leaf443]